MTSVSTAGQTNPVPPLNAANAKIVEPTLFELSSPGRVGVTFPKPDVPLADLQSGATASLMPLISDKWTEHFQWRGDGPFDAVEREKLRQIVEKVLVAGVPELK